MKKHIMFVSWALLGHANQMIALAQELVCRGYQVSFVIPEAGRKWLSNTGANFIPWELTIEVKDQGFNYSNESFWSQTSHEPSNWRGEKMMFNLIIKNYEPMYKTLAPIFQQHSPDMLLIDRAVAPAMDLAQQMNIPYIIQTQFLGNLVKTSSKYPRFGTSYSIKMNIWQRCLNFLKPPLFTLYFLPSMKKLNQVCLKCNPSKNWNNPFEQHLLIVGTSFGIEIPRPLPPLVQMVGPIFPKTIEPLSPSLNQWLEEGEEVVYMAFGTLATIKPWQAKALVEGLTDTRFRVLWSLPKNQQSILPSLPSSFRIEHFVSQQAVLSHPGVRVFVSHCGMNSINEALYWEKPILALPFFGDQYYNAARVVDLGVALKLNKEKFDTAEVRCKIDALLNMESYRNAAHRMSVILKISGGVDKAADIVENTLAIGISHLIS